jgi:cytoskeletal protein RodZ
MSDGLKKMGEKFRTKREEMSLTLKEVENATSIRTIYLQAIEEGRIDHFLSNVYALGFIRQYGGFLGFESEKLVKEFPDAMRLPPEKQDFAYGIGTLEKRTSSQGGGRSFTNVMWGATFVLVAVCAWYFAKFVGIF